MVRSVVNGLTTATEDDSIVGCGNCYCACFTSEPTTAGFLASIAKIGIGKVSGLNSISPEVSVVTPKYAGVAWLKKRWHFLGVPSLLLAVLCSVLVLNGCRRGGEVAQSSPEATVKAFFGALADGQTERAAEAFDIEREARMKNPDWDMIPQVQRNATTKQMFDEKVQLLEYWTPRITQVPTNIQVVTQGNQATATVTVDGNRMYLLLVKDEGIWRIIGLG